MVNDRDCRQRIAVKAIGDSSRRDPEGRGRERRKHKISPVSLMGCWTIAPAFDWSTLINAGFFSSTFRLALKKIGFDGRKGVQFSLATIPVGASPIVGLLSHEPSILRSQLFFILMLVGSAGCEAMSKFRVSTLRRSDFRADYYTTVGIACYDEHDSAIQNPSDSSTLTLTGAGRARASRPIQFRFSKVKMVTRRGCD